MSNKENKFKKVIHMAGIVPVSGRPLDFKMPWHDSLMPIGPDYLAIQRAVYECALAGCETIWVVAHEGIQPLIRKVVGDYIADPVSLTSGLNPTLDRRIISVFYVPIKPSFKNVKDCLGWTFLYGANIAYHASYVIWTWMVPRKFYCAFPYGVMPEEVIWKNRKRIGSSERTFFSCNGKTAKDDLHMSFTINEEQYKACRSSLKNNSREITNLGGDKKVRDFTLQEVLSTIDIYPEEVIDIPWFHDISNWNNYRNFLSSEECTNLVKNKEAFLNMKRMLFPDSKRGKVLKELTKQNIKPDVAIVDGIEIL